MNCRHEELGDTTIAGMPALVCYGCGAIVVVVTPNDYTDALHTPTTDVS